MNKPILPIPQLIDALRVALAAANKIENPFLVYLVEMATFEAEHFNDTRRFEDLISKDHDKDS